MSRQTDKDSGKLISIFVNCRKANSDRKVVGATATDGRGAAPLLGAALTDTIRAINAKTSKPTVLTEALRTFTGIETLTNAQARDLIVAKNGAFVIPVFSHSSMAADYRVGPGDIPSEVETPDETSAEEAMRSEFLDILNS